MTYGCYGPFPVKFLIKSMRYETWLLRTISFTTPYQNPCNMTYDCSGPLPIQFLIKCIEIWDLVARGNFLYNSLPKSLKYDLWLLRAISFTTPYQNHWNMTCDCYGLFPLQFLIKIIEIWPVTARDHFLNHSFSKSL